MSNGSSPLEYHRMALEAMRECNNAGEVLSKMAEMFRQLGDAEVLACDLAMLLARTARKCPDEKLKGQAMDFLRRKNLFGSPLRDSESKSAT